AGTTADGTAPSAPASLAGDAGTTTVDLAWGAASDDVAVVGYRISRDGTMIATTSDLAWSDAARTPLTTYTYSVVALDTVGNASDAVAVTVQTLPDTLHPTRPLALHKVARSGAYVTFDWSPSTDNVKVAKYYIYRVGRSAPVAVARISRIRIATIRGASYYVRAVDTSGNRSAASGSVRGRS
ncbi:MAG: alpha-amylase, partial [Chloroflexota bacterium]